jgi:hypothetical protein
VALSLVGDRKMGVWKHVHDQVRLDDLLRVQALIARRGNRETFASRIVAVRTSNTEPARVEVETETGTRDLIVPMGSELLSRLIQFACSNKRIRLAVTDDAQIEAVEAVG